MDKNNDMVAVKGDNIKVDSCMKMSVIQIGKSLTSWIPNKQYKTIKRYIKMLEV